MIQIRDLNKVYRLGEHEVQALKNVSLSIEAGDFVAIMGPSGSGKSTLMQIMGLLDTPTGGSYQIQGREAAGLSDDELAVLRRETVGFIFQQFHLLGRMSAAENVGLPLFYSGRAREASVRAGQLLERVGLAQRQKHRPNEMSGGQQQRVAIARALINEPQVIFADEPTGNLDSQSEKDIMSLLRELNDQGITVVLVTHEEEIGRQAKRLIRMRDGVIQSDERLAPLKTYETPAMPREPAIKGSTMPLSSHVLQGFRLLWANKVRTLLSVLGILIGIASVVAMLALGQGAQQAIESQLSSLGSNLLVLRTGSVRAGPVAQEAGSTARLTVEDANAIQEQVVGVKSVAPNVNGRAQMTFGSKNWNTQILATSPSYETMRASSPTVGRFFTELENRQRARVVLLGMTVARNLFGDTNPVGETIRINRVSFLVIGLLPEKGASGWRDQDDTALIPLLTGMHRLLGRNYVDSVDIEMIRGASSLNVQDDTKALMNKRHNVRVEGEEEAFSIRDMADLQAALSSSSRTMSLLLAAIAGISLLVGGIGIMNIMLVSVTERTREIGLRKAIGAQSRDILMQFLIESLVVSGLGGIAGIVIGVSTVALLQFLTGWAMSVTVSSIALSFGFSATIGLIFGLYPARQASRLNPITALRHD